MKLVTGWVVSAGLILAASAAHAQMAAPSDATRSPYRATSDFDRPDPAMPPEPPAYRDGQGYGQGYGPRYNQGYNQGYDQGYDQGYGPPLMPPQEVYAVLRENGFSPLGIPHQRGFVYTISVIDRAGEDGHLMIDARTGRILRFVPASRWGGGVEGNVPPAYYGPQSGYGPQSALPPPTMIQGAPRPPASVPRVASQAVPMPKPAPARPALDPPPQQQSAAVAVPARPIEAPATTGTIGQAASPAPAPLIRPTQPMPKIQGLE
jgi:hypothetical protein